MFFGGGGKKGGRGKGRGLVYRLGGGYLERGGEDGDGDGDERTVSGRGREVASWYEICFGLRGLGFDFFSLKIPNLYFVHERKKSPVLGKKRGGDLSKGL